MYVHLIMVTLTLTSIHLTATTHFSSLNHVLVPKRHVVTFGQQRII